MGSLTAYFDVTFSTNVASITWLDPCPHLHSYTCTMLHNQYTCLLDTDSDRKSSHDTVERYDLVEAREQWPRLPVASGQCPPIN